MANKRRGHRRGFTIIELLVALTLFTIVMTVAVGSFVRALRIQRQLAAFVAANGNVSLAIEQMAREIRTGRQFAVPQSDTLSFTNARNEVVTYALDADDRALTRTVGAGNATPITSETITLRTLRFVLQHGLPTDGYPARVTITLVVSPREQSVGDTQVRLQTTVSARSLGT